MRFAKIPLYCLLLILMFTGWSQAQHIGCDDLIKSSNDTLRLRFFEGPPGETVLMPVILTHDSIITAFQFLIEYDTTWLTPVFIKDSMCAEADTLGQCISWNIDSSFIDYVIGGRFVKTETTMGPYGPEVDTVTKFQANLFQGQRNVIAGSFLPEFDDFDSLPPPDPAVEGSDTIPIFYIKLQVSGSTPEMQLSEFTFFESDIFTVIDTIFPPETTWFNGCNEAQLTTVWYNTEGDSTVTYQIYPTTDLGFPYYFRCNSSVTPDPTVSFSAYPTTIVVGQTSTLTWSSTNADSVVIRDEPSGTKVAGTTNLTSGNLALSSLSVGTHNFSATAYADDGSKTAVETASVIVNEGSTEGPDISVSAIQSSYNQGELITFTVTATNTNGTQITLSTTSLPANAAFGVGGQVTGYSPLTGDFSWTPGFTQLGLYTIRFTAVDGEGTSYRDVTLQIEELPYDRLFSTSEPGNQPVGGLPGTEGIRFPIDLITSHTVYGVQFDMLYPHNMITIDSFVTTGRIPDYIVSEYYGSTPGQIRVVTLGLNNEPVMDTNTTAILIAVLTLDSSAVPWETYTIYLENGRESVNPDPLVGGSLPLYTDSGIVEADKLGDVNLDKIIDVADAVNIVAYIIENYGLIPRQFEVADIITNDSVNVFDLVADINLIFGIEPSTLPPAPGAEPADVALAYGDMSGGSSDFLTVTSTIPEQVAGVQLELNYDPSTVSFGVPQLTEDNQNFALKSNDNGCGRLKILLFHMAPLKTDELMQAGAVDLVEIPVYAVSDIKVGDKTKIRLTEALLSTASAGAIAVEGIDAPLPTRFTLRQNYPNPFNPTTTIEFEVGVSASGVAVQQVNLDVFNILGQHVKSLADGLYMPGEYQIVWDATNQSGQRVATGIYLYRLKVDEQRQTKKMLFLK